MRSFVIGGAGFIGSHLVDALLERGPVTVLDRARTPFIERCDKSRVKFIQGDILGGTPPPVEDHDVVFHLAANPEARWGLDDPSLDLREGTIATYRVLEACRLAKVRRFVFTSSGAVYGIAKEAASVESALTSMPISLYAASKLASEAMISAYVECFAMSAAIVRFGNVVGPRASHGVILDLLRKLAVHPERLEVLGDGSQSKPYLHVNDCVAGLLHVQEHSQRTFDIFNLAPDGGTTVRSIAQACVEASPYPKTPIAYGETIQGWRGDVPRSRMSTEKLTKLGFTVRKTSDEAVARATLEIAAEVWPA